MRLPGESEADAQMARSRSVLAWLPWAAAYPFKGFCLPVLVMVTLFTTLGVKSDALVPGVPTTGIPLLAITAIWTLHYLMRVIQHTARGHAWPPAMTGDAVFFKGAFAPLLLPALAVTAYFALRRADPPLAHGIVGATLFVTPAYLFVLATEESLPSALNPLRWLELMLAAGIWYLLPSLVLAAGAWGLFQLSSTAASATLAALFCYTLFSSAHLLGYIGFLRREKLGLHSEVRDPDEAEREQQQAERLNRLLLIIENALLRKDEDAAAKELRAEPGGPVNVLAFFEDVFQRLLTRGTPYLVHESGRRLITELLKQRRSERALEVAELCFNRHSHFEPNCTAELDMLARQALHSRNFRMFDLLLRNMDERYPNDPYLAQAALLRAQYLAEQRKDDAGALALLQPWLTRSDHPLHGRINALARALQNLKQHRPSADQR